MVEVGKEVGVLVNVSDEVKGSVRDTTEERMRFDLTPVPAKRRQMSRFARPANAAKVAVTVLLSVPYGTAAPTAKVAKAGVGLRRVRK